MLKKIISGGQTGADQAGLLAGRSLDLETGGTAPHGWKTEDGSQESLLKELGLHEGPVDPSIYKMRTRFNVQHADGTVIFGVSTSAGSKLTIRYCNQLSKPYIVNPSSTELWKFAVDHKVETLNVAGNRESKNPGIGQRTYTTIMEAFKIDLDYGAVKHDVDEATKNDST